MENELDADERDEAKSEWDNGRSAENIQFDFTATPRVTERPIVYTCVLYRGRGKETKKGCEGTHNAFITQNKQIMEKTKITDLHPLRVTRSLEQSAQQTQE